MNPIDIIQGAIYDALQNIEVSGQEVDVYKRVDKSIPTPYVYFTGAGFGEVGGKTFNTFNIVNNIEIVASSNIQRRAIHAEILKKWPPGTRFVIEGAVHLLSEMTNVSETEQTIDGEEVFITTIENRDIIRII